MSTRTVFITLTFAATVAASLAGLTFQAETKEAGVVENACAAAAWPYIPAKCLDGAPLRTVRVVSGDDIGANLDLRPALATR